MKVHPSHKTRYSSRFDEICTECHATDTDCFKKEVFIRPLEEPCPYASKEPAVETVCLVGSSRFKDVFRREAERLEKSGCLVLMMGFFQHADGVAVSPEEREVLRRVDRKRIELADRIYVISPRSWVCHKCRKWLAECPGYNFPCPHCGNASADIVAYVGEDTRLEIEYAKSLGKPITYLEPVE